MAEHNTIGSWGEQIATDYLTGLGYAISEHNWRMGHYEIDIVAFKGTRVIFVEVKTRTDHAVDPLEAITPAKIRRLTTAANTYIKSHNIPHEAQFDLIFVIGTPGSAVPPEIEHIPDAFRPPLKTYR